MITNFLESAFSSVIRPVYVNKNFGSSLALGLIIAANGGGAMFGAFLFGWIGHWFPRRAIFISMFIFTSFRFVFYVFYPPLWVILLSTFIFSVSAGPLNPIIDAIEFECIPVNLRGRVLGSITAGMWVAMPLSILVAGVLVDQFGIFPMILGIGFIYFVTTVSLVFLPSLRLMGGKNEIK
jgi:MFS family permease